MLKIVLLCVIGAIIYLVLGAIATIEHFERMGLHSSWYMLFWPFVYLGIVLAQCIVAVDEVLEATLAFTRKVLAKWRKKR